MVMVPVVGQVYLLRNLKVLFDIAETTPMEGHLIGGYVDVYETVVVLATILDCWVKVLTSESHTGWICFQDFGKDFCLLLDDDTNSVVPTDLELGR